MQGNETEQQLAQYTFEDIQKLKGVERTMALVRYHKWLNSSRQQDRKEMHIQEVKIWQTKNRERYLDGARKRYHKRKQGEQNDTRRTDQGNE